MEVYFSSKGQSPSKEKRVLTIGNFDGLHLGHREIIKNLINEAKIKDLPSFVYSFDPHPLKVLQPENAPKKLFSRADLIEQLDLLGVNGVYFQKFDKDFSELTRENFIDEILVNKFNTQSLVIGYNFNFGSDRGGNIDYLKSKDVRELFQVKVCEPVLIGGKVVSSSRIRDCLRKGQVKTAKKLLSRDYHIEGEIIKGDGRGSQIGISTANMRISDDFLTPKLGVYVSKSEWNGQLMPSITNIGRKPTFQSAESSTTIETHLFNEDLSLYGETLKVHLISRLRDEIKFNSIGELVFQIQNDIIKAKKVLDVKS